MAAGGGPAAGIQPRHRSRWPGIGAPLIRLIRAVVLIRGGRRGGQHGHGRRPWSRDGGGMTKNMRQRDVQNSGAQTITGCSDNAMTHWFSRLQRPTPHYLRNILLRDPSGRNTPATLPQQQINPDRSNSRKSNTFFRATRRSTGDATAAESLRQNIEPSVRNTHRRPVERRLQGRAVSARVPEDGDGNSRIWRIPDGPAERPERSGLCRIGRKVWT